MYVSRESLAAQPVSFDTWLRDDPRVAMAERLPAALQPFLTWLTAKPAPGEAAVPRKPMHFVRSACGLVLVGCLLSVLALTLSHGILLVAALALGMLLTTSGLGLFQVVIFHHCSHGTVFSTRARNRIEHAQVVDPADIPRFAKLGVIASMQPNHLLTDLNWAEARLGPRRAAYSYAWKAFLDAGVPLAFGTDYPVEPITPFRGLYAAVTRMSESGKKSYFPENKLTRGQALYAYTQGSAYAEFAEQHKGKLLPGYDADFILVDRDLYKTPASAILWAVAQETFVGGEESFTGNAAIQ